MNRHTATATIAVPPAAWAPCGLLRLNLCQAYGHRFSAISTTGSSEISPRRFSSTGQDMKQRAQAMQVPASAVYSGFRWWML